MSAETITDAERYPTITKSGLAMLKFLKEHPSAPIFRNQSGNKLTKEDIDHVLKFDEEVESAEFGWKENRYPKWFKGIC